MEEAALLYEQKRQFLPISFKKTWPERKYSNTMATVYLAKYSGAAMLAMVVGPSALWTMEGNGETGQSLF